MGDTGSSGLMQLNVKPGDIVHETADVYVTTVFRNKNLKFGPLASRVYENFGRDRLQQNLNNATHSQTTLNHGQVVMIRSGESASKHVITVCLDKWRIGRNDDGLQRAMKKVLELANRNDFTCMALPALGMGGLKYPPFFVAMTILSAIFDFKRDHPSTRLSTIVIPLLDRDTNSIRTFLQSTIAFINGHQMTCDQGRGDNMFDLRGVTRFHGLENTRPRSAGRRASPEQNTQLAPVQEEPPTYILSGQRNNISYGVGTSFSISQRRVGVTINVSADFRQYLPQWMDRLLPG